MVKEGRLQDRDWDLIWRPPLFPQRIHHHLITLLETFEILYHVTPAPVSSPEPTSASTSAEPSSSPPTHGYSLIPSLLPQRRPDLHILWPKHGFDQHNVPVRRVYIFAFVPHAFFSRLMARLLHIGQALAYWRNGLLSSVCRLVDCMGAESASFA